MKRWRSPFYRVPTAPGGGWKWQSRGKGKVFLGIAGDLYAFHLEIGRFGVTFDASEKKREARRIARRARLEELIARRSGPPRDAE